MHYQYKTTGTCSRLIDIDIDPSTGIIEDVKFTGGCHGNLQGIGALVRGLTIDEVIDRLKGIKCGNKATSCPDQLACALSEIELWSGCTEIFLQKIIDKKSKKMR